MDELFYRDEHGELFHHFGGRIPTWQELNEGLSRLTEEDLEALRIDEEEFREDDDNDAGRAAKGQG